MTYPAKNNTAVMTIVLKALTFIESIRVKVSINTLLIWTSDNLQRMQKEEMIERKSIQKMGMIKRKILFEEEEARVGLAAMNINDEMKDINDD